MKELNLPSFKVTGFDLFNNLQLLIADYWQELDRLLKQDEYTWENFISPLELMESRLSKVWSLLNHLHMVADNEDLRMSYQKSLDEWTKYCTLRMHHEGLYQAIKEIKSKDNLNSIQLKALNDEIREFYLSGIECNEKDKLKLATLFQELAQLNNKFAENLLDSTQSWNKLIFDKSLLAGLPEKTINLLQQKAQEKGQEGYFLSLDAPIYEAVLTYAQNRLLREEMYRAYVSRASEVFFDSRWDNSEVIVKILSHRSSIAKILQFDNYAEYSLDTRMAKSVNEVLDLLVPLADRCLPKAKEELDELYALAKKDIDIIHENNNRLKLELWDLAYYREKLFQQKYNISQNEIRNYFPLVKVLEGIFYVAKRLFGINFVEKTLEVDLWHQDVKFFAIYDSNNNFKGAIYVDLYAREGKQGGAWMDDYSTRYKYGDNISYPIAFIVANFSPPLGDEATSYLTHYEVQTLFHEFGHGLHHILSEIDYAAVSGLHGVPHDGIELPSQLFEEWAWSEQVLHLMSAHRDTNLALPQDIMHALISSKNFHSASVTLRQVIFGLFDILLHRINDISSIEEVLFELKKIRNKYSLINPLSIDRFPHTFSHIFAGGYAAGYYGYQWSLWLSSDVFAAFTESGNIFSKEIGLKLKNEILSVGGSRDFMSSFIAFRGRNPDLNIYLQYLGLK